MASSVSAIRTFFSSIFLSRSLRLFFLDARVASLSRRTSRDFSSSFRSRRYCMRLSFSSWSFLDCVSSGNTLRALIRPRYERSMRGRTSACDLYTSGTSLVEKGSAARTHVSRSAEKTGAEKQTDNTAVRINTVNDVSDRNKLENPVHRPCINRFCEHCSRSERKSIPS